MVWIRTNARGKTRRRSVRPFRKLPRQQEVVMVYYIPGMIHLGLMLAILFLT